MLGLGIANSHIQQLLSHSRPCCDVLNGKVSDHEPSLTVEIRDSHAAHGRATLDGDKAARRVEPFREQHRFGPESIMEDPKGLLQDSRKRFLFSRPNIPQSGLGHFPLPYLRSPQTIELPAICFQPSVLPCFPLSS